MRTLLIAFFVLVQFNPLYSQEKGNIILLFGSPCAGKSTLAKELIARLPGNYQVVKRTKLSNNLRTEALQEITGNTYCTPIEIQSAILKLPEEQQKKVNEANWNSYYETLELIKKRSDHGENVIFDVCLSKLKGLESLEGYPLTKVLVYAPLSTLSTRERARALKNGSPPLIRQKRRNAILDFYCKLYKPCDEGEQVIDTVTREEVIDFEKVTQNRVIYPKLSETCSRCKEIYTSPQSRWKEITPVVKYDVLVNSGVSSPEECAFRIEKYLKKKALLDNQLR